MTTLILLSVMVSKIRNLEVPWKGNSDSGSHIYLKSDEWLVSEQQGAGAPGADQEFLSVFSGPLHVVSLHGLFELIHCMMASEQSDY